MIQTLITGRCKGEVFRNSHIGQILQGRTLTENDFDQRQTILMDIDNSDEPHFLEEDDSPEKSSGTPAKFMVESGFDSDEIM